MEYLVAVLRPHYDTVLMHVPIYRHKRNRKRQVAEIDIVAIKGDKVDLFEVKCSPRIAKAKRQIKKWRKYWTAHTIDNTYVYCGDANKLISLEP